MRLRGIYHEATLQSMSAGTLKQLMKKGKSVWGHLFTITTVEGKEPESIPGIFSSTLEEYTNVFMEPATLPPRRKHDHFIPLQPESIPVSIRPYKYNYFQKNEIENQIKEMLKALSSPTTPLFPLQCY